jgi:ribokinase
MKGNIIVVGSLNMDLVVHAPRHPRGGETLLGSGFATYPGGKGANQAVAAARLGGSVAMIGRVGDDAFGQTLIGGLRASGVDTSLIRVDQQQPTGVALITLNAAGQNTIVVAPGANAALTVGDIANAETAFVRSAVLLVQLEIPLAVVEAAIKLAVKHRVRVLLNPAPATALADDVIAAADFIIPNQSELALLTGLQEIGLAIAALHRRGARHVIVTLGEQGARYSGEQGQFSLPAIPIEVVDTTAAGDAFLGALAVALVEDKSIGEAIRWGTAAGALAVSQPGAQSSLPRRGDLERLLR